MFLFVGSRHSYKSKFAVAEVTYAFKKMEQDRILPYLIDDSDMPDTLDFLLTAVNRRRMDTHPIDTVLIQDIKNILGKVVTEPETEELKPDGRHIKGWVRILLNVAHAVLLAGAVIFTGMYLVKLIALLPGMWFLDNLWQGHFEIAVVTGSFLLAWYGMLAILNWEKLGFWIICLVLIFSNYCYWWDQEYDMFSWQAYLAVTLVLTLSLLALLLIPKENDRNVWSQLNAEHRYLSGDRVNICFWIVAALTISLIAYALYDNGPEPPYYREVLYNEDPTIFENTEDTLYVKDVPFYLIRVKDTSKQGLEFSLRYGNSNYGVFSLGKTTVTCRQWKEVMGYNKAAITDWNNPVTGVSWYDCLEFCIRLSSKLNKPFSLPSVEQWNLAARAGSNYLYSGSDIADEVAWYAGNSGNMVHAVGQKKPNAWGFYDMSGNVWEWCSDPVSLSNPDVRGRAVCGGSWDSDKKYCRVGGLGNDNYIESSGTIYHGFRLKMEQHDKDIQSHIDSLNDILKNRYSNPLPK